MKAIRSISSIVVGTSMVGALACASTLPPQDLVDARKVYDRASIGPAAQSNPADMHAAKVQLDVAEASFVDEGDTQATRDEAYLAIRKTQLALVLGRTHAANEATDNVVNTMHADQKETVAKTAAELERSKDELAAQSEEMKDEKARRKAAEQRAADLAKIATVKQEPRGMVITLSGGVLFESAKWELLPAAQAKLNQVADALMHEDPLSTIVVEGHTDSQGGAPFNQQLSEKRAEAVRGYLVTRGVAADRLTSQGLGLTRPVADNKSPEGRANNRRVEIVVQPASR